MTESEWQSVNKKQMNSEKLDILSSYKFHRISIEVISVGLASIIPAITDCMEVLCSSADRS